MRRLIVAIALLTSCLHAGAQGCNCPDGVNNDNDGQPHRVFAFSNGQSVGLCGYNSADGDSSYTQFSVYACGTGTILETFTVDQTCKVTMEHDAMYLQEMAGLPIGQNFSTIWRPFLIHKYYLKNGNVTEKEYYRKDLGRYSKAQLDEVFAAYRQCGGTGENMMHVANMLFWASVSGSKEAEADLESMPQKYGPFHGVIGEEWADIYAAYEKWKSKQGEK